MLCLTSFEKVERREVQEPSDGAKLVNTEGAVKEGVTAKLVAGSTCGHGS